MFWRVGVCVCVREKIWDCEVPLYNLLFLTCEVARAASRVEEAAHAQRARLGGGCACRGRARA